MVSVIVPVLNNEKYIDTCIESILCQTYTDFELLLMVGRCSDSSLEKCIAWQRKDERIIIVSRKDTSLGDARNYALPIARGDFVAYVDADDRLDKNFLMEMVVPLEKDHKLDISCCGYIESQMGVMEKDVLPKVEGSYEVDFKEYFNLGVFVTVWCKVYRKEFLLSNEIRMFDGLCEDESFTFILASMIRKIYVNQKALYYYTIDNAGSLMNARNYEARIDYVRSMEFAFAYMIGRQKYLKNRDFIKNKICVNLQNFLCKYNFESKMVHIYKQFINKYFPEIIPFMLFSPRKVRNISFVMFGAGKDAHRIMKLKPIDVHVSYIVDNNKDIQGKKISGVDVFDEEMIKKENRLVPILISSRKYRFEISETLYELGFKNLYYIEDVLTMEQLKEVF